jgi:hypothetical protein
MLEEYIDFVKSLFPCISPYTQERAKECIRQFYILRSEFPCFTAVHIPDLNQGDIISKLPFRRYDDEGDEEEYVTDGLIISNSCDIENDNQILIAPFFPISELGLDLKNLKNNAYFSLLFFPDNRYSNHVADLSLISPFPKKVIQNKLDAGSITKKFSLNQVGYYLLISKITVHLLRPEDTTVQSLRDSDSA